MSADNAIAVVKLGENDWRVREIGCSQMWTRGDFTDRPQYKSREEALEAAWAMEEENWTEYGLMETDLTTGDYEPFA